MRVSRASMLLFAALAAVVLAPSGTHARGLLQAQVCVLPATVAPTSQVLVGGSITTPIAAKVRPTSSTTFSGSFAIVFPAPCPTAATLAAALPKAYIATVKGSPGVSLADTKAVVTMGTPPTVVANVLVGGLKGTTLSAVGPAGVAAPTVTATAGTVTTSNSVVPIKPYSLAGQSMLIAGTGCTLGATGATVTFSCPKLSVAQTLNLDVGSGIKGGGSLAIQGSLTATGKLSDAKLVPASTVPAPKA